MNAGTTRTIVLMSSVVVLFGETVVQSQAILPARVEKLLGDVSTPGKRPAVVAELIRMAKDPNESLETREMVVLALGDIEAVEAKGLLRTFSETLDWRSKEHWLKGNAYFAWWQIRVAEERTPSGKVALLLGGLDATLGDTEVDDVRIWAAQELANLGREDAMPRITACINRIYSGERAEDQIDLCKRKIELLKSNPTRYDALVKALYMKDPTRYSRLKQWAIKELGKLGTQESRSTLVAYALDLENQFYERHGERMRERQGVSLNGPEGTIYDAVIRTLKRSGMSAEQIKTAGLHPYQCFLMF